MKKRIKPMNWVLIGIIILLISASISFFIKASNHIQRLDSQVEQLQEDLYFAQANIEFMKIEAATYAHSETTDCELLEWIWNSDVLALKIFLKKVSNEGFTNTANIFTRSLEGMQHRFIVKCGMGFN